MGCSLDKNSDMASSPSQDREAGTPRNPLCSTRVPVSKDAKKADIGKEIAFYAQDSDRFHLRSNNGRERSASNNTDSSERQLQLPESTPSRFYYRSHKERQQLAPLDSESSDERLQSAESTPNRPKTAPEEIVEWKLPAGMLELKPPKGRTHKRSDNLQHPKGSSKRSLSSKMNKAMLKLLSAFEDRNLRCGWIVMQDEASEGPFDDKEMKQLWQSGEIGNRAMVTLVNVPILYLMDVFEKYASKCDEVPPVDRSGYQATDSIDLDLELGTEDIPEDEDNSMVRCRTQLIDHNTSTKSTVAHGAASPGPAQHAKAQAYSDDASEMSTVAETSRNSEEENMKSKKEKKEKKEGKHHACEDLIRDIIHKKVENGSLSHVISGAAAKDDVLPPSGGPPVSASGNLSHRHVPTNADIKAQQKDSAQVANSSFSTNKHDVAKLGPQTAVKSSKRLSPKPCSSGTLGSSPTTKNLDKPAIAKSSSLKIPSPRSPAASNKGAVGSSHAGSKGALSFSPVASNKSAPGKAFAPSTSNKSALGLIKACKKMRKKH